MIIENTLSRRNMFLFGENFILPDSWTPHTENNYIFDIFER